MAKKKKDNELIDIKNDNILIDKMIDVDEIKEDLEKYVDDKINKVFIDELDKTNRKLLREKSKKIFVKNIVIIILLLIIGFLVYLLYSNNYFDKLLNKNSNQIEEKSDVKKESEEKNEKVDEKEKIAKEPTLDELKKEYASLLDNYIIHEKSSYLHDFYTGKLTDDLKNYLTLNSINFDSLSKEDDYEIIQNDTFKLAYEKLFDDNYSPKTFDYNDNTIRYVNAMSSYITEKLLNKEESNIKREIKNIKVSDDKIIITTIEGIVIDSKLYNILNNEEIDEYNNDSLLKYSDNLNKVTYSFKNNKLTNLEK